MRAFAFYINLTTFRNLLTYVNLSKVIKSDCYGLRQNYLYKIDRESGNEIYNILGISQNSFVSFYNSHVRVTFKFMLTQDMRNVNFILEWESSQMFITTLFILFFIETILTVSL